jgi:hypothetical protein
VPQGPVQIHCSRGHGRRSLDRGGSYQGDLLFLAHRWGSSREERLVGFLCFLLYSFVGSGLNEGIPGFELLHLLLVHQLEFTLTGKGPPNSAYVY